MFVVFYLGFGPGFFFLDQAQWGQYNQAAEASSTPSPTSPTPAAKRSEENLSLPPFDVHKANEEIMRVNQEFDDEMHESQWFAYALGF